MIPSTYRTLLDAFRIFGVDRWHGQIVLDQGSYYKILVVQTHLRLLRLIRCRRSTKNRLTICGRLSVFKKAVVHLEGRFL